MNDKSSSTEAEFSELLNHLIDGTFDDSRQRRLEEIILGDADLRGRYLDFCQMHAILLAEHGALYATVDDQVTTVTKREEGRTASPWAFCYHHRMTVAFIAATLLLAVLIPALLPTTQRDLMAPLRGGELALVNKVAGVEFAYGIDGTRPVSVDMRMPQGPYELLQGLVELEYDSGAILVIQAPAHFELIDDMTAKVSMGKIAVHVPEQAIGFVVETAGGPVTDLGTDFAIDATENSDTEIYVFKGEVRVEPIGIRGLEQNELTLVSGTAMRIDGVSKTPAGIAFDDQKFLRSYDVESCDYSEEIMRLDPAVYYRMEPSYDGYTLEDSSPSQSHAMARLDEARQFVWTTGKLGAAIELGGPQEPIFIAAPRYPQADGDELSAVAWVYAESRPWWASIVKNWGYEIRGQFHFGLLAGSGELEVHVIEDNGEQIGISDDVPLPLGEWHHAAMVVDGDTLRLYRNGQEVANTTIQGLGHEPRLPELAVGSKVVENESVNSGGSHWHGKLDEVAVFNHALSAEDIRRLYELGLED